MNWQLLDEEWVLGVMTRGVVREAYARIAKTGKGSSKRWHWVVFKTQNVSMGKGSHPSLLRAIEEAEEHLFRYYSKLFYQL